MKYERIGDSKNYIRRFQFFLIPLMKLFCFLLVSRRSRTISLGDLDLDKTKRYVIVANHKSMADPFIVCYSLPFSIHRYLAPYRFFVVNRMFKHWWLRFWLFSLGCFPAKWHSSYKFGITYATELNEEGQTLVIFPEGRVAKIDREYTPKRGVELLARQPHTLLVPARTKWNREKGLLKSYSLSVGKPFSGKNMTAEQIMDVVYSLKFS